ncbi:hypothetical protein [Natronorubrum sp. FCH18a]|uniref:hypothetical protein n=1 Tax=Natronorubrum sp. FCH18a TaxID=3447018 RepID=UPI003F5101DF
MTESESPSRTIRFKGERPPWKVDDSNEHTSESSQWEIRTVTRRTTNADETAACVVTGETVPLNEAHYFVTSTRSTPGRFQSEEYDHAIVAFEGGLEELERHLEDDEESA